MKMKQILSLLVVLAMISPVMAKGKKQKPIRGRLISITAEQIIVKVKKENKTYIINAETKILDKDSKEVAVADVKFRLVSLKAKPDDAKAIIEIKERVRKAKKKKE